MRRAWLVAIYKIAVVGAAYVASVLVVWDPRHKMKWRIIVGIVVIGLSFLVEYYTNIRPAKHWNEVYPVILDQLSDPFLEFLRKDCQIEPRINILIPTRTYHSLWVFRWYFTVWWSAGMNSQPDVNISFPTWHGVAGECYRAKKPIYAPLAALKDAYKFPTRLRPLVSDIQAIISYPIYEPRRRGRQSGNLIGVINLDSKTANTYTILTEAEIRAVVHHKMQELATVISEIYH